MPLLLDDSDPKGQTGFDLSTATTLFWRPVPVHVKQQDREDVQEELTFRILTGVAKQNHNLRILRIHISSDSDLFFLHTLEVSEEDFQSLKNDQGILVDFASFPGKIISLLEKCILAQPGDSPRFQAVLTIRGGESVFKIVEINDFKQLPHITLAFRPGNDSVVKQFLAFRLSEVKGTCHDLSDDLSRTRDDRDSMVAQLAQCRQQLAQLREQYDKHLLEVQAQAKTQQASAHEERIREKSQLKDQFEKERGEMEGRYRDQIAALNTRLGELDTENRKLREVKYELDTKVSELSHKLGSSEGSNRSLEEETARLRSLNQQLSSSKHELEIQLNEAKAKVLALDEKAQSQGDVIEQQRGRLRDMEAALRQTEQRCADLRDTLASAEGRAKEAQAEVLKSNQAIEKLTNDLRLAKEKTKRKAAIILRQEEELQEREQSLANATRDVGVLGQQAESLRKDVASLHSENDSLRSKLEDSKQQLQSNEQMIRWLNQQVTEAQLHASGATVAGSRYTFRPSAALPGSMPPPSVAATPAVGLLAAPGPSTAYKPGGTTSRYASTLGVTGLTSGLSGAGATSVGAAMAGGSYGAGGDGSYRPGVGGAYASSGGAGGFGGSVVGGGQVGGSGSAIGAATGAGSALGTYRSSYAASTHPSPGGVTAGMGSTLTTPAVNRYAAGSYSSVSSSLSFGGGLGAARAVDATPAASKYGVGFSNAAMGVVGTVGGAGGTDAQRA